MRSLTVAFAILAFLYLSSAALINDRFQRSVTCEKRLPMTDYFEHGYDLSEYDIYACPEMGGKRAKFTNLNTCDKRAKFRFSDEEKTEYDVPDQLFRAYEAPFTSMSSGSTFSDMTDLKEDFIQSTVFETFRTRIDGIEKTLFKNSQFYKEMKPIFANNSHIALTYYKVTAYGTSIHARQYNKTYFTPGFVTDVNSLPENFDGNEKTYLDFIKKYGTHVMSEARFGAAIYRFAEIRRQDLIHRKENDINWEMRKDAMALNDTLDIICQKKDGNRQVLKVHAKNRDFTQVMVGGYADARLYANRTIPLKEIHALPALTSSEVQPISTLIADNTEKEKGVQKAIKVYLAKAYIRSKVNSIQILLNSGRVPRKETTELLAKAQQSENVYNEEELSKLGNDLKREKRKLRRS